MGLKSVVLTTSLMGLKSVVRRSMANSAIVTMYTIKIKNLLPAELRRKILWVVGSPGCAQSCQGPPLADFSCPHTK
jgi:hypothetical protein